MISTLKDQLRIEMRQRREHFAASVDSVTIQERFLGNLIKIFKNHNIQPPASVALYCAKGDEAPTDHLIQRLFDMGFHIYLPKIGKGAGGAPLEFHPYKPNDSFTKGPYGIMEPDSSAISDFIPDIIICPCLAFNTEGHRLGYGKGYYDKTLSLILNSQLERKPLILALAFSCQETSKPFADGLDVAMDGCVTEE